MMATTHALAGVVLAVFALFFAPDAGPLPVVAAALGGLFPDFDLYAGHRKTLHFPVYYAAAAAPAIALAAVVPTTATLSFALFLAAAALHSAMDALGGGLELKPWEGTSDRAVYDHFRGRWVAPRRWVRYDGAPEDLALAGLFALPALVVFDGPVEAGVYAALAVSAVYALLRKPLVAAAEWLVEALPAPVLGYIPERFLDDFR
ncbi:metal-dependent hydrolase [Halegenticoccus soli]|uniref:metal-dependent hydrolase n=1 Tax=Halegenticoccus soli TaxID=1985678 RepID=UPI0018EB6AEA|nr:metal-dependent hydrolase [Halegenticoccus soli]